MNPSFKPTQTLGSSSADLDSHDPPTLDPQMSPVAVFVCSAREDASELNLLLKHLAGLRGDAVINHVENIPAGTYVRPIQLERIRSSRIAVVIVTPNLLASEGCQAELQAAFERMRKNQLSIVPVLAKPCDVGTSQLADLAVLPRSGIAISASDNPDHLWSEVAKEVRRRVEKTRVQEPGALPGAGTTVSVQNRSSLLIIDCSSIPDFGKVLAANLATQFLVTIRSDLADGAHRTHDFTVLCVASPALPVALAKTAMQLVAAEEERSEGRFVVLAPTASDNPFQEIPYLQSVNYDPTLVQGSDPAKLQELQRSALAVARVLASVPARRAAVVPDYEDPLDVINSQRRLWAVIVDLRDVLIQLPGKIGTSIKYPEQFAATKTSVADDVRRIAKPFYVDAKNCGTTREYERLVNETVHVILNLPHYYEPLLEGKSWSGVIETVMRIVITTHSDDTPGATRRALEDEADRRLTNTVLAYAAWWEDGQRRLSDATTRLLDAIQQASLSLSERLARQQRRLPHNGVRV